jgi:hypothetical protein
MLNIVELIGKDKIKSDLKIDDATLEELIDEHLPIPKTPLQISFVERLTLEAVILSSHRHAGGFRDLFGGSGKTRMAEGKDLTSIKYIIGTGGALTRLPNRVQIMQEVAKSNRGNKLLPTAEAKILVDNHYIMASLGVLSKEYPEAALTLLKKSMGLL